MFSSHLYLSYGELPVSTFLWMAYLVDFVGTFYVIKTYSDYVKQTLPVQFDPGSLVVAAVE